MKADNKSKSKESHLKCLMNEQSPGREKKNKKTEESQPEEATTMARRQANANKRTRDDNKATTISRIGNPVIVPAKCNCRGGGLRIGRLEDEEIRG